MEAVSAALESDDRLCFLVAQKNAADDDPDAQLALSSRARSA
jgi:hypothetical protein